MNSTIIIHEKWNPRRPGGLSVWLDANNPSRITKDGSDFVSNWVSQEGNEYSFVQATAANQPKWYETGFGSKSKSFIDLDGVNDFLNRSGNIITDNVGTIAFIASSSDVTRSNNFGIFCSTDLASNTKWFSAALLSSPGDAYGAISYNTGAASTSFYATDNFQDNNNDPMIVVVTSNGSSYNIWVNGVKQTTLVGVNNGTWFSDVSLRDNLTIGAALKSITSIYFKGKVAEICYYNNVLSDDNIDHLNNYFNTKYGVY